MIGLISTHAIGQFLIASGLAGLGVCQVSKIFTGTKEVLDERKKQKKLNMFTNYFISILNEHGLIDSSQGEQLECIDFIDKDNFMAIKIRTNNIEILSELKSIQYYIEKEWFFPKNNINKNNHLIIQKSDIENEILFVLFSINLTEYYTSLFADLKIINPNSNDWICCEDMSIFPNYTLLKFKISNSLKSETFKTSKDVLEEKILTSYEGDNYKNKLDIYLEKGFLYFQILREYIPQKHYEYKKTPKHLIPIGNLINDDIVFWNLKSNPHIKIVAPSGRGKSRLLYTIINHLYRNLNAPPLWLMDFKDGAGFGLLKNASNVKVYADDAYSAYLAIKDIIAEYDKRKEIISKAGFDDFSEYIAAYPNSKLKRCFLVIDEFADLMDLNFSKIDSEFDMKDTLVTIARKYRWVGIHIIVATQSVTSDSMPPGMKRNIVATIGLGAENEHNSRLILDITGLEKLRIGEAMARLENNIFRFNMFFMPLDIIKHTISPYIKNIDTPMTDKKQSPTIDLKKQKI